MQTFKDRRGNEWTLDIHIGTRDALKAKCGIDLYNPEHIGDLFTLVDDPSKLIEMLAVICNVTDMTDFAARFDGDAIDAATKAFWEEAINFIRPGQRPGMRKMVEKANSLAAMVNERIEEMTDKADVEAAAQKMIERESTKLMSKISEFGNTPAYSESIRAP